MLARLAEHTHCRGAGFHQVAHGLMRRIRNPHRRELAGPVQFGQHYRVAAIRLDPIPSLHRDQRGRHYDAVMTQFRQLPMQAIATGASFVAKAHSPLALAQLLCQLRDLIGAIGDDPQLADFTTTHPFGDRNRDRRLMHIQSHEIAIIRRNPR